MADKRWWPTATEIAHNIRADLSFGKSTEALRILMDGVNRLPDAAKAGRLEESLQEPPSTGDVRWDTLFAACLRYRLHTMGERAPAWTYKEPLDRFWWPVRTGSQRAYVDMVHAPAELMRVGIFLDEKEFATA